MGMAGPEHRSATWAPSNDAEVTASTQAFTSARSALARLGLDGRFLSVNPAFAELVGRAADDLAGVSFDDVWSIVDCAGVVELIERIGAEGGINVEVVPRGGDPDTPTISARCVAQHNAKDGSLEVGFQLISSDLIERKRTLSADPRGFELSFDQIEVGMLITGLDGVVGKVNRAMCRLLARTVEQVADTDIFAMVHPDDRQGDLDFGLQAYVGEIDGWTREKRLLRPDGELVWVLETVTLVRDENGEGLHFLSQFIDITDRKRAEGERALAEEALRHSEAQVKFLAEGNPVALVEVHPYGELLSGNAALTQLIGRDWRGLNALDVMHPDDVAPVAASLGPAAEAGADWTVEFRIVRPDESVAWVRSHNRLHHDADGEVASVMSTWIDITDEVNARETSTRLTELLEAVDDVVAVSDPHGRLLHLNRAGRSYLPAGSDYTDASAILDLFTPESGDTVANVAIPAVIDNGAWTGELTMHPPGQERRVVSLSIVSHRDRDGHTEYLSAITRDITPLKQVEERLRLQATTDPLTGLANRTIFFDRLANALARSTRRDTGVAVLFVDLDRFKPVNDAWGHETGDQLLIEVSRRLLGSMRDGDTVARLGGDEFVVLAEPIAAESDAVTIGERIVAKLAEPYPLVATTAHITASVGLAVGAPGATPRSLVHAADLALYEAKNLGGSKVVAAEYN
jgi:diguanylate cyclase (GGDEF)-like protein/PAS domain S-box-containing protein